MQQQRKDNTGVLFTERQKKTDNSPDMTGEVMVNGKTMRVAGWKKDGKNGEYLSLSFKVPDPNYKPKNEGTPPRMPTSKAVESIDDEIPF